LPNGAAVANFSLATSDRKKDNTGEYFDQTEWHNLVAWDRTAEIIRDYVKKGSKIYIEGKLQTRSWEDKATGEKKYRTEVFIRDLGLLSTSNGNGNSYSNGNGANHRSTQMAPPDESDEFAGVGIDDSDIPF